MASKSKSFYLFNLLTIQSILDDQSEFLLAHKSNTVSYNLHLPSPQYLDDTLL